MVKKNAVWTEYEGTDADKCGASLDNLQEKETP